MNRTDTSKGNKTPLDATGITSLLRNTFYALVPVPPNCCLHLAEPNSCCLGEAPLQLPLAGCSSWASSHCTAQRPVARLLLLPLVSAGRDAAPRERTHPPVLLHPWKSVHTWEQNFQALQSTKSEE